jgi:hypothetical protein
VGRREKGEYEFGCCVRLDGDGDGERNDWRLTA